MNFTDRYIQDKLREAVGLLQREKPSLDFDIVHERSTSHRLAVHMETYFDGWNVDCEYNRDCALIKDLSGVRVCDSQRATDRIIPDIIVHHRGRSGKVNNLLVVEIKKNIPKDLCDAKKLELLTDLSGHYQYQLGLYINIFKGRFRFSWYKDGKILSIE